MNEMEEIRILEEELTDLNNERALLNKKIENIELEKKVLSNKEEEIYDKIRQVKGEGTNRFLGKIRYRNT